MGSVTHSLLRTWPAALLLVGAACGIPEPRVPEDAGLDADAGAAPDASVVDAGPLSMAPGEVVELELTSAAPSVGGARLATPTGNEQFVLIIASTDFASSAVTPGYSLGLSSAPEGARTHPVTGCSLGVEPWRSSPPPTETPPGGTAVAEGTVRSLKVPTPAGYETIDAQAIAVGQRAVVWADTTAAHPASLDAGFVTQFLTDFENTILPRERAIFGVESDQDGDGHVALVFSPLTYQTAVAFFSGCDLVNMQGCVSSNHGEYLYLTPPSAIAPPYNTPNAIKEILTHECSHLIHFNRKVLRNGLASWPDSAYLDEGVGGFAQDAVGPQAGNLYVTKAGLDGIRNFSLADTLFDNAAYDTARDGVLRGGSYLFVRYLYDRAGADVANSDGSITGQGGPSLFRALLDAPESVAAALPTQTGAPLSDIAADFYTALAMSNRDEGGGVAPLNPCFAYLPSTKDPIWNKQRGADLFATFSMQMTGPSMQSATVADGQLRSGGVEYVVLDATAGTPELGLAVLMTSSTKPRVRIGRLR